MQRGFSDSCWDFIFHLQNLFLFFLSLEWTFSDLEFLFWNLQQKSGATPPPPPPPTQTRRFIFLNPASKVPTCHMKADWTDRTDGPLRTLFCCYFLNLHPPPGVFNKPTCKKRTTLFSAWLASTWGLFPVNEDLLEPRCSFRGLKSPSENFREAAPTWIHQTQVFAMSCSPAMHAQRTSSPETLSNFPGGSGFTHFLVCVRQEVTRLLKKQVLPPPGRFGAVLSTKQTILMHECSNARLEDRWSSLSKSRQLLTPLFFILIFLGIPPPLECWTNWRVHTRRHTPVLKWHFCASSFALVVLKSLFYFMILARCKWNTWSLD